MAMQKLKGEYWFLMIIAFTAITLLTSYTIPSDSPLVFIRYIFGFIFVSFIPGYCLLRLLFSKSKEVEIIEGIVLSIVLSFSVAGLVGLFLGLTPVGLNFTSVTVSLAIVVLFLTFLAFKKG